MALTFGKLEARITVPTGGWDTTVGGVTKTIPAGTYYLSSPGSGARDLIDEVAFQFGCSAAAGSFSENGTGLVTLQFAASTAIAWVDTDLRDILGFTDDLAGDTIHTGTRSALGIWMPDCPANYINSGGHWRGHREGDYRSASNPAGYVWAVHGNSRTVLELLEWHALKQARTWITNEATVNESLERFLVDGVWGEAAWGTAGGPIRWHPDASVDTAYGTYKVLDLSRILPEQAFAGWSAYWRWTMPKMVQVPGSEAQGLGGTSRATMSWALKEADSSTADGTTFTTGTVTPSAGKLQVLDIAAGHGTLGETPLSVVGCGVTWVLVGAVYIGSGGTTRRLSRYRALGPTPSSGTVLITFANAMTSCAWNWNEATGADASGTDGSGAFVQTVTATAGAGSTTINATLAPLEHANNSHLAAVALNANASITPDAQFAELGDDGEATPALTLETEWAANQVACDPTFAAAQASILSSEIKAAWV